jgi:hypothetical protein
LQSRLESVEKYKGCAFPSLPGKTIIGKNSENVVESRKEELQIYIQLLAKHTLIKYDPTLKFFLTYENYEEFERVKNSQNEVVEADSTGSNGGRNLGIKDTFNYLYSSIKTKLGDPQSTKSDIQLDEINEKSVKHISFLNKIIGLTSSRIAYQRKKAEEQLELSTACKEIKDESGEVKEVSKALGSSFKKESAAISYLLTNDTKLLSQLKEKKLKQEGIQAAIAERKAVI